ncbi:MAG: SAVED domain-containing protein [Planctomycetota bacterium]
MSPESTGGITAGTGFDFQTRYAACCLPTWLSEAGFHQLFHEGTGDFDIRYHEGNHSYRLHCQLKDHDVGVTECKEAVARFRALNDAQPGLYRRFTLVCPTLAAKLRPVEAGLARLRNAQSFYDDVPGALAPTKAEVDERLRRAGFDQGDVDFIHNYVYFEVGHGDLLHDERAIDLFIGRLLKHPEYADKLRAMVLPAFAELMRAIQGRRGAVLDRVEIEQLLRAAVAAGSGIGAERAVTVWVHNWTRETFDVPADYAIDWSQHFDRTARRVPSADVWNRELLPELKALKDKILVERKERLIRYRGKCTLSTGVALGATFPAVGGWTFEIPQPPAKDAWRSDVEAIKPYEVKPELVDGVGTDLVLALNIRGDGREDVRRYIESTGTPPRLFAFVTPPQQPGSQSIAGAAEAVAFARAVREHVGQLLKQHGITCTRLFFYGPFALAVFLGQQLTSVGEVQLFEYQDPGYTPSLTLRT